MADVFSSRLSNGRPPDWFNGSTFAISSLFTTLFAPLVQLRTTMNPTGDSQAFLRNYATALNDLGVTLETLAQQLDTLANTIANLGFTASRLWVPLDSGGNTYVKTSFRNALESLEQNPDYDDLYFSFGVVLVTDATGEPGLKLLGGIT